MAELRLTSKTKFAILECKKFLEHLFLSRQSIAASLVCGTPRARAELFFTPSRDYRNFLAFWKLFFSNQWQSHLVKFRWKFNSNYKNNVLAYMI